LLALIMGLTGFFIGGLVVHVVPMLIDQGMSPTRAAQIAAFNGIALIAGRMATGWLLDRYRATSIAMAIFFLAAVGCLTFAFGGVAWAVPMVLAMGIMIGSEIDLLSYLVLRYFDKDQAPAAFGALFGLFMGGSIASPWLINLLFTVGDYQAAFGTAAGVFSFTIFLFFLLSRLPMAAARPAAPSA
jgi:predicted MFS family arabinose efflux permease